MDTGLRTRILTAVGTGTLLGVLGATGVAAFASEVEELKADVEWRKGVMKTYEAQLEALHNSRSFRYTATVRRLAGALRSRRS